MGICYLDQGTFSEHFREHLGNFLGTFHAYILNFFTTRARARDHPCGCVKERVTKRYIN